MKIKSILGAGIAILLLGSCTKDFLQENPPNFTTADGLYSNVDGFEAGINGLYSLVREERDGLKYTGGFGKIDLKSQIYLAGTDNIATGSTGGLTTIMADWDKNDPTDSNLNEMFLWLYKVVRSSNQIIHRAETADVNWDDNTKNRVLAEAHTIRAWAYRHLTYLWGDVPLITEEISGENIQTDLTREKVAVIRQLMIKDLKFGAEHLDWTPYKAGRLTKGVAQTYL
ncbi:MAG: RagB/SusD family nutrient uptake outer membrane protein, partial [Gillisia sp.]